MIAKKGLVYSLLAGSLALALSPAWAQVQFDFMPDGGRGLLVRLFDNQELQALATDQKDIDGWRSYLSDLGAELSPKQIETLAGYLSVNLPLDAEALALADAATGPISAYPLDGKELAVENCQFCHSIFTGYFMQRRDAQGWRSTFLSPFHREIPMNERHQETFALYSATNMPLDFEDVPPELRF
jgi:hypothetical protein